MNIEEFLNLSVSDDLLPLGKSRATKQDILELFLEDVAPYPSLLYPAHSERQDLISYLDYLQMPITEPTLQAVPESLRSPCYCPLKSTQFENDYSSQKQKKVKKVENSPFHNYQKHLNNALKKLVILPYLSSSEEEFKVAARDIWRAYVGADVKTKKILHFVFNEKNEHSINQSELRSFGLLEVYQMYGTSVISKAKNYLSKLAIDQIDESNIQNYIKSRKMRKTEGFKEYIMNFRKQLQSGYIKRRVHLE